MTFDHRGGYYRISVNVDPDKTPALVAAARALGVNRVFVGKGRGVLRPKKWGPFTVPGISPLFDALQILVPERALRPVMDALVKAGDLSAFGEGSIYATRLTDLWLSGTELFVDGTLPPAADPAYEFETDLVSIHCISQLDHAEEIAHAAIEEGSPSPVISFGSGHGIRDRLGFFLQLTINPKKELIELVVGADEAERVFDAMVEAGHLDQPAQGFIYTRPVEIGLINTVTFQHTSPYPATMEQIIKAIDQLQGGTEWRRSGALKTSVRPRRRVLNDLVSLTCLVNRGFARDCSMAAMEAGASGTSTLYANAVPSEVPHHRRLEGSDEREVITLTVGRTQVAPVTEALMSMASLDGTPVVIFAGPAPLALTYLSAATD